MEEPMNTHELDRNTINATLKKYHVNLRKLCTTHNLNYKTIFGWLSGRQATLNPETTEKVRQMMAIYREEEK